MNRDDRFLDSDGREARNRPMRCWECPQETFNASGLCDDCTVRSATLEMRNGGM